MVHSDTSRGGAECPALGAWVLVWVKTTRRMSSSCHRKSQVYYEAAVAGEQDRTKSHIDGDGRTFPKRRGRVILLGDKRGVSVVATGV